MFNCRCFLPGALLLLPALAGCGHAEPVAHGPSRPALVRFEKLSIQGSAGTRVASPHYLIYSTIPDPQALQRVADVMEGALAEYRTLAPDVPLSSRPMDCYLFDTRQQWAAFTKSHTGEDAGIYLRVNRGGYTVGDWYVAYWMGETATYSVAAHEGWHQFVARHLKGRLPPFLEEGLACLFEQVQWEGDLPRWDLSVNGARLGSLRSTVAAQQLYPLKQLVRMHAGQVVGKANAKIEAFYAQSWAYARFLCQAEGGRYRPALRRMLADASRGSLFADTSRQMSDGPLWDPSSAKPMLEHYLGMPLDRQEEAFHAYIDRLVSDVPAESGG